MFTEALFFSTSNWNLSVDQFENGYRNGSILTLQWYKHTQALRQTQYAGNALPSFLSAGYMLGSPWRKEPQLRKCLSLLACKKSFGAFS